MKKIKFFKLKMLAHIQRAKHFLKTGRDIQMLPPPTKDYCRAYFFEIEDDCYVLKYHEIPLSLGEKFYEDFNNKNGKLMGLTREEVVKWVLTQEK